MVVYLAMNIGVLGVVPWQEAAKSDSVASLVLERTWGKAAADVTTVLILLTAFGSVFAGLLGGSRVPYNAARDGVFFARSRGCTRAIASPTWPAGDGGDHRGRAASSRSPR